MTKVKLNLTTVTEQMKLLQSKMNSRGKSIIDFKKGTYLYENKKFKEEANISLKKSVEASLKATDMSFNCLQNEYKNLIDNSGRTTIQLLMIWIYSILLMEKKKYSRITL